MSRRRMSVVRRSRITIAVLLVWIATLLAALLWMSSRITAAAESAPIPTAVHIPTPERPAQKHIDNGPRRTSLGIFTLTAYCPCARCCGVWAEKRPAGVVYTASGTIAEQCRTVAVDPSIIPYGTTIYIGGQAYVAEDCGGAIKGNHIDIYFDRHADALEFGVQATEVTLEKGGAG